MNKNLKLIIPGAILLIILAWIFWPTKKDTTPTANVPAKRVEQINKIPLEQRPFVTLTPRADGRELSMIIDKVTDANSLEYELEYQAEALIQGVFGTIDFSEEPTPVTKDLLFGSCSKGKCRFDEGVTGGSLTLRFDGGSEAYVLKSDFNLQEMFDREGVFSSKDAKATLDVGRSGLPNGTYITVASTMGLPQSVDGQVLAGPYAFLSSASPTLKAATVTIKSTEDLTGARIMYWDGNEWEELDAEVEGGKISAATTALGTFVLVK